MSVKEYEGRISPKGPITIPRELREKFGLKPGDMVRFLVEGDGIKVQRVVSRLSEGFGAVEPHHYPEDWTAVRRGFEELVAEDALTRGQQETRIIDSQSML